MLLCAHHLKKAPNRGKSILSLFVLFVAVLHEDLVFRSLWCTVKPDGADVVWDGMFRFPAVPLQWSRFPVIVAHCCFPIPPPT